jgi:hypothetical protein
MRTSRTRLLVVAAAALATVAAGGAVASAHPGDDDPFGRRDRFGLEGRGPAWGGGRGLAGWLRGMEGDTSFVRQESTFETEEGLVTHRVDAGTLVSATDNAVEYSLADGQTASVSLDEDTEVIAFEAEVIEVRRRGGLNRHLTAETVEPTESDTSDAASEATEDEAAADDALASPAPAASPASA